MQKVTIINQFCSKRSCNSNFRGCRKHIGSYFKCNSHNWYGILMNFQHKINDNWNFSVGTDDRYYYGYHYQVLSDLYGASGYTDNPTKTFQQIILFVILMIIKSELESFRWFKRSNGRQSFIQ
jgi:hypothetical protein